MIFYFTGTGNSLFAAQKLLRPEEQLVSIADSLNNEKLNYEVGDGETVGFVFPVYFYSLPSVVRDFVRKLSLSNASYIYAVITCGGGIGQAGASLAKELNKKGLQLHYLQELLMPDNSMLFYQIPKTGKAVEGRIQEAQKKIDDIITDILARKCIEIGKITVISDLMSLAYRKCMGTDKFYAEDTCIGCGKCALNCPNKVIALDNGKPVWQKNSCCKCSACINRCPVAAIQYGKNTKKRNRYDIQRIGREN